MYEPAYSLIQLIGISSITFLFGISVGGLIGRAVQRKYDDERRGPRFYRKRRRS